MPRRKEVRSGGTQTISGGEKIFETDVLGEVSEIDVKTDPETVPEVEAEEELAVTDDADGIEEELDPFKDTWEE